MLNLSFGPILHVPVTGRPACCRDQSQSLEFRKQRFHAVYSGICPILSIVDRSPTRLLENITSLRSRMLCSDTKSKMFVFEAT